MAVISGGPLKGKKTTRDERILDLRLESLGSVGSGGSVALCYDEHVELRAAVEAAVQWRRRRRRRRQEMGENGGE